MRSFLPKIPEYYFILLVLLVGFKTPFSFNPFALLFAILLGLQIYFKFKTTGLLLGVFFLFINLYFLGALLSEYAEYISGGSKLLWVGVPIWVLNMTMAIVMIYKYVQLPNSISKLIS
ncbi:MAG: hypothetical protein ACWA5P_00880 [bacterium]